MRTYWINGKYFKTDGTGLENEYDDTFVSEGGNIPEKIKKKIIIIGKNVLKSIMQFPLPPPPLLRIDFGCCLQTDNCDETYFVNEIETASANMLDDNNNPIVEKAAEAFYQFAKKVKGKKNIMIGSPSNFKIKNLPCPIY